MLTSCLFKLGTRPVPLHCRITVSPYRERMNRIKFKYLAYQGGVMYKNAPEKHYLYRFFIFLEVNVLWTKSGLRSFAIKILSCAEVGTGVKARRFSM